MLISPDSLNSREHQISSSHYAQFVEEGARRYIPLYVLLELTHHCHLNCVHCYLEDNHNFKAKVLELTYEGCLNLIDQLVEAGCLFLTLSGGEIFLRSDTIPIARYARSRGLALSLYTSGTLMNSRRVQEIKELHPLSVEFSLYSADNPELHDSIVRISGSHQKTLSAIRLISQEGIPVVIKTPLMREIFAEYPKIIRLAKELGIAFLLDTTVTPKNDRDLSPCQHRLTREQLIALFSDSTLPTMSENQPLPFQKGCRNPDEEVCNLGKTGCAISPFGDIYPILGYPLSAGNVREVPFLSIWRDSPLFKQLREVKVKDLPLCSRCEKFSYCNRCCMWALMDEGDFFSPSLWACELAAAKEKAAGLSPEPTPHQLIQQHNPPATRTAFGNFLCNP